MTVVRAAIYARVSSERQADAGTIASQVAALRARVAADGLVLAPAHEFLDEGHSGATLVRPALERLRDLAALGGLDRLYVHAPDRLARRYAYQVLLVEEFAAAGVAVVFLNRAPGRRRRTRCCSRSKACWRSTSARSSWSAAGAASGTPPTPAR